MRKPEILHPITEDMTDYDITVAMARRVGAIWIEDYDVVNGVLKNRKIAVGGTLLLFDASGRRVTEPSQSIT